MPRSDDNHHLWRNGRFWWVAFVALDGVRQIRVRQSLKTDDVHVARARRDALIREYEQRAGWEVPLRIQTREERRERQIDGC